GRMSGSAPTGLSSVLAAAAGQRMSRSTWRSPYLLHGGAGLRLLRVSGRGRRKLRWQVFGDDGPIELSDRTVGKASPDLVHPKERNAEVAAQGQRLTVRTQRHHGVVHLPVAGIDDVATLVAQSLPFHAPHQRQAKQRSIPAIIRA